MPSFIHYRPMITIRQMVFRGLAASAKKSPSEPTLNCATALIKAHEKGSLSSVLELDVTTLQGIGPKHQEQLHKLHLKTVADLANYKFFHLAKAICVLAETEQDGGRLPETSMNINKGVDKAYENRSLREIAQAPVSALQGISQEAGETLTHVGVRTVQDLASFKFCRWAEAMQTAAKYEQEFTKK